MSFSLAAEARTTLEACGYTFFKRAEDGWWQMLDGDKVIASNRSQGDLLREQANKHRAW